MICSGVSCLLFMLSSLPILDDWTRMVSGSTCGDPVSPAGALANLGVSRTAPAALLREGRQGARTPGFVTRSSSHASGHQRRHLLPVDVHVAVSHGVR